MRSSTSSFAALSFVGLAALLLSSGCIEKVETASVSLDLSACFLVEDGFRGGGENAGDQAGRAGQQAGSSDHFGGDAICRAGLQAYAEQLTMCLAVRVGGDASKDGVCQFAWDTTTKEMSGGDCQSGSAVPELSTEGEVVAMRPFFLKTGASACPDAATVNVDATCGEGGVGDCLFTLPVVSETLIGTKDFVLAYGYKGGLTPCDVECVPTSVGSMPVCWDEGTSPVELCDAVDNDCDGQIDEDFSVRRAGPNEGVAGACAYTVPAGQGGGGEALPLGAACDGVGECAVGTVICGPGAAACGAGDDAGGACCSTDPGCEAADSDGGRVAESCDSKDNDCDGDIDELFSVIGGRVGDEVYRGPKPGSAQAVAIALGGDCDGVGGCGIGEVVCAAGGAVCSTNSDGPNSEVTVEVCNNQDDDCDGIVDEGLVFDGIELGEPCSGQGQCADGLVKCNLQTEVACCSSNLNCGGRPNGDEICDGLDNDCDGEIDEDYDIVDGTPGDRAWVVGEGEEAQALPLGSDCAGVGECSELTGHVSCSADQLGTCCTALRTGGGDSSQCMAPGFAGPPEPVQCADRTDPATCVQLQRVWGDELCDELDNDCDGRVDEDFETGFNCNGDFGVCAEALGVVECADDGVSTLCSVNPGGSASAAGPETCDGLFNEFTLRYEGQDEDCDGRADPDERNADGSFLFVFQDGDVERPLGFPCNLAGQGECGAGIVECDVGDTDGDPATLTRCSSLPGGSNTVATPEQCNQVDDDCDAEIDEDWTVPDLLQAQVDDPDNDASFFLDGLGDPAPLGAECQGTFGRCADGQGQVQCAADRRGTICSVDPGGRLDRSQQEDCNGIDDDCDGRTEPNADDPGDPDERDRDLDGALACEEEDNLCCIGVNSGCDGQDPDLLASVRPGGPDGAVNGELCDEIDNDCSGLPGTEFDVVNENDRDGDGFTVCDPEDLQDGELDCDDQRGGINPDADESCNGFDDDCDGDADEDFQLGGSVLGDGCGQGLCAGGVVECRADGAAAVCSTMNNGSADVQQGAEACNGLDDDCDGNLPQDERDRDGDGFLACDGDVPGILDNDCNDAPGRDDVYPGALEVCDNRDNNCDGTNDATHFDFNNNPDHCGACDTPAGDGDDDNNCDAFFDGNHVLVAGCSAGNCNIVRCEPNWYDLNGDTADGCEYNCLGDPFGDDEPDSAATDADCDGLDGDLATAVFLDGAAANCVGDACGKMPTPYNDLTDAYEAAEAVASIAGSAQILVAAGTYTVDEPLALAPGVSIFGGFCPACVTRDVVVDGGAFNAWARVQSNDDRADDAEYVTEITLDAPNNGYAKPYVTIVAQNLNRPTTLGRLTVRSDDAPNNLAEPAQRTSAAIVAEQSAQNLRLRDLILRPGDGGRGGNGGAGGAGEDGADGLPGPIAGGTGVVNDGAGVGCATENLPTGGAGGGSPSACVGALSNGGQGGAPGLDVSAISPCDTLTRDHTACVQQQGQPV